MDKIQSIEALEALYGQPASRSLTKVVDHLTPLYSDWIAASRFVVIASVGPGGTDASPRGDKGAVARAIDAKTLHIPDWMGNNRLDTLRNIVEDGRVSLMFMVPGAQIVVRVNGSAEVAIASDLVASFATQDGKHPRSVIVVTVAEVYFQCAKAIMRAQIWAGEDLSAGLPTAGALVKEQDKTFDDQAYDAGYDAYAKPRMW